ncbi:GNAT family N-acetyltransferase [Salisediminibacterium halotolerans]|uniref:Acetyltransferase (GNAT) family protein n=1 Tax=Salisediminibacterium halotolerans TaxID=517425 RepID=A0A1H9S0U9_9BACI|nr:GNAT family N-acetyltransferase [Salisediminibacterium haloalkalitolerans]SER78641.1 Acetyltransferase (GNAT) family protein [Salisediminibacterium haloalkalitolerans]
MVYQFAAMSEAHASEIAAWMYEPPYDFYDMKDEIGAEKELLDGSYLAVFDESVLAGYVCFGRNARIPDGEKKGMYTGTNVLDIGLGLKPDRTGKGEGAVFLREVLDYIEQMQSVSLVRLTVAMFNERAIRVYKSCGFITVQLLQTNASHDERTYVIMECRV